MNVGFEVLGKGASFSRPVLILRKFNKNTFLGIPMTTSEKKGYFRYPYTLGGEDGYLLLDQVRAFDIKRLEDLIARMHPNEFN